MATSALPEFSFPESVRRQIFSDYVTFLYKVCGILGFDPKHLDYSERELGLAVDEAEIDIRAMFARRSRTDGIAPGKIAGIVAFRLSRFKIVHIQEGGWEHGHMHLIQELAAVLLVRHVFVQRHVPERSVLELAYQFSRRHANQETAGLFFDACAAYDVPGQTGAQD